MSGEKQDEGKLRYDPIPAYPLQELARVYTIGSKKYGDNNWRSGIAYSRIVAALQRHLEMWKQGRDVDPDDGQHPLASVAWCALTLMEYEITHPELDNRADNRPARKVYIPGKPCPVCHKTCQFPEDHTDCCCHCNPGYHHTEQQGR